MYIFEIIKPIDIPSNVSYGSNLYDRLGKLKQKAEWLTDHIDWLSTSDKRTLEDAKKQIDAEYTTPTDKETVTNLLSKNNPINKFVNDKTENLKVGLKKQLNPITYKLNSLTYASRISQETLADLQVDYDDMKAAALKTDRQDLIPNIVNKMDKAISNRMDDEKFPSSKKDTPYTANINKLVALKTSAIRTRQRSEKHIGKAKSDYNVSADYLIDIGQANGWKCGISGVALGTQLISKKTPNRGDIPSIDRIDSTKSYEEGNVQLTTVRANLMKGNLSHNEFLEWCQKIVNNSNIETTDQDLEDALAKPPQSTEMDILATLNSDTDDVVTP